MIVPLDTLKPGDKFLNIRDNTVYKVVSEAVDGEILCADDDGFAEMFKEIHIVRPISQ